MTSCLEGMPAKALVYCPYVFLPPPSPITAPAPLHGCCLQLATSDHFLTQEFKIVLLVCSNFSELCVMFSA